MNAEPPITLPDSTEYVPNAAASTPTITFNGTEYAGNPEASTPTIALVTEEKDQTP